ncbi:response regulator transcription factor [bacterium]|nr:response regulator transcription factor [bacterium]
MSEANPRILLIDDQEELLETLDEWLRFSGYRTETASGGQEALEQLRRARFDVVVTDLQMPGITGLELLSLLKQQDPTLEVIFLTGQGTMADAIEALREGRAFDFLQKPLRDLNHLNAAIDKAFAQKQAKARSRQTGPLALPEHVEPLSTREVEIILLLARGLDNREIADRLVLSEKTVKNHLTRIYEKLKVSNRTQAVILCQQYGII